MYERSPQKSPQSMILNRHSLVLPDHPDGWAPVSKSVCGVLKWASGYPGKRSRQSEITLQAVVSGMGRPERKSFRPSECTLGTFPKGRLCAPLFLRGLNSLSNSVEMSAVRTISASRFRAGFSRDGFHMLE